MKNIFTFGLLSSLLILPFCAEVTAEESVSYWQTSVEQDKDSLWKAKLRARTLIKLDKMLNWAIPIKDRAYLLKEKQVGFHYVNETADMVEFGKTFGYFSKKHPIISRVTPYKEDIILTSQLLKRVYVHCKNEDFLEIATGEILSKVLAYRALDKGMIIPIPVVYEDGSKELVDYIVDEIFTLWLGMPAFGLVPKKIGAPPILLFRGTDLSLESKQGWASVLSDLDIQGPGLTAFQKSKSELESWLKAQANVGTKAKVMGFSLGGVLAMYTMVYENALVNERGSMAFNPPGISAGVYKEWKEATHNDSSSFRVYITHGDLIPKIGKLAGDAYELSLDFAMRPIDAHVRLICCQPTIFQFAINQVEENRQRD